jgi:hypothetical protein
MLREAAVEMDAILTPVAVNPAVIQSDFKIN